MKKTVLVFLFSEDSKQLLMMYKKNGQGAGKINVPGGKLHENETEEAAAIREFQEETGLTPQNLVRAGKLEFYFPHGNAWENTCTVFRASGCSGNLIRETQECINEWVSLDKIPYEKMWDSDRRWAPLVLQNQHFHRSYTFNENFLVSEEKIIQ